VISIGVLRLERPRIVLYERIVATVLHREIIVKKRIVIVIVVAASVVAAIFYFREKDLSSDDDIKVSGNIEATDILLSFQVGGKLAERLVDEGYTVKKEQILARLDKNELTKTREQAQAALAQAQADCQLAQKEFLRMANLLKENATSVQDRDVAEANYEVAQARLRGAQRALELAEIRLSYADLKSPINGFVTVRSADVGEVLQVGSPVFTVVDLNDIWLTAYVNETDLGRVRLNQPVDVKIDTYPDKAYKGHISFISQEAEFTPKQIQTTEERVKLVYRIKVVLANPNLELKPGMPADGYVVE
jgi:HlyD family secretion protein